MSERWVNFYQRRHGRLVGVHTIPTGDTQRHTEAPECACKPTQRLRGTTVWFIHTAHDGRDLIERYGIN
jgi:hypothetical protein